MGVGQAVLEVGLVCSFPAQVTAIAIPYISELSYLDRASSACCESESERMREGEKEHVVGGSLSVPRLWNKSSHVSTGLAGHCLVLHLILAHTPQQQQP